MRLANYPSLTRFTAILALVSILPTPILFVPRVSEVAAAEIKGGSNPTPEDRARRKAEYQEYLKKEKLAGQERLGKILAGHEASRKSIEKVAPYWKQGEGFASTVIINNTRPRMVEVTPIVRTANGRVLPTRPVRVRAAGSVDVPLSSLIGDDEGYGQIALRYDGEPLEINAVIVVANGKKSLSVDHLFEMIDDFTSSELDGVFYLPKASTRAELALSNTSDKAIAVSVEVRAENENGTDPSRQQVAIKPHQTEMVNVRPMLKGSNGRVPIAARIMLKHTGAPADLRVHGMLMDANGYSANMRFLEASALAAGKLFSPILPLQDPVSPIVLLTNANSTAATVHLEAYYSVKGDLEETTLRTVSVPAGGAIHVDLSREVAGLPRGASDVGLVFEYYAHGGLLADVLLIDESGSGVYQVSPKGYGDHSHNSHSFPFRIEGSLNTIITMANPSETEEISYSLNLYYEGKVYGFAGKPLRPGEIRNINIKALQDKQVPGQRKELIPPSVTSGHVTLDFLRDGNAGSSSSAHASHAGHGAGEALGIASATIFDVEGKMAFVTCHVNCSPEWWTLIIANQYYEGVVGEVFYTGIQAVNILTGYWTLSASSVNWTNNGYPVTIPWELSVYLNNAGSTNLTANVSLANNYCDSYCTCIDIFGDVIPIALWVDSYQYSVTVTGLNFDHEDPMDDTVTVVANGPYWSNSTLTVQVTSNEDSPVTLRESAASPNTYQVAFHPSGAEMPAGKWSGVAASYGPAASPAFQISPPRVDTQTVVALSWVDGSAITLPSGANSSLVSSLNSPLCSLMLLDWWAFTPTFLNTSNDTEYANKWLVKNSANSAPPSTMSPSVLTGGDFRMFNSFKAAFRKASTGSISDFRSVTISPVIGGTPDPCGVLSPVAADAHTNSGSKGISSSGTSVYQLSEGRLGSDGRRVNLTINGSTTPWIWTIVSFDGPTGSLSGSSIFPKHTMYINTASSSSTTPDLSGFIALDDTYQASIP